MGRKMHPRACLCVCVCALNCVQLFVTPWTVARQAPLSMGFPRQEYWGVLPFPFPGDLPNPAIEPKSLASPALARWFFTSWATREAHEHVCMCALSLQLCLTLCDPMDCGPSGSSVQGILQARILGVGCHAFLMFMSLELALLTKNGWHHCSKGFGGFSLHCYFLEASTQSRRLSYEVYEG